jgi:hypothetical protein
VRGQGRNRQSPGQAAQLRDLRLRAAPTSYGDEVGRAIVLVVEEGDFIIELPREILHGAELDDLQVLNSPMSSPNETNSMLIPVKTWREWELEHQETNNTAG